MNRQLSKFVGGGYMTAWVTAAMFAMAVQAVAAPKNQTRKSAAIGGEKKATGPAVPAPQRNPDGTAPKIGCAEPVHDFGTTWMGPVLTHTFTLKNEGNATLDITRVRPSCGCTIAGTHPKSLAPGETGEFPFSIKSTKLRGRYEKSITISSNDPDNPQYKLKLQGYCKRYVDVVPSNATFGKVFGDEPQERILKITNNTDDPVELEVDPKKDGQFTFELLEKTAGKEYELRIRMEPPFTLGQSRNYTTLKTSVDAQKEIRIAATAHVPPRLDVQPNPIRLSARKTEDRGYRRTLRFTNYGKDPVKVLSAELTDSKLKAEVNERTSGKAYTIGIDIPAGYSPPTTGAMLTLKTDDKKQPEIKIPIQATAVRTADKAKRRRPAEEMVGKASPAFSIATTEGKELSSAAFKDKVTVLDFFAVNCGFCKKQIPRLEKVRQDYEKKGVRFVAVSQTMRKKFADDEIKSTIDGLGFKGELAIDSANTVGPLFKATGFPTMVVVDKAGKVAAVNVGNVGDLETRMKTQLDALLAGKPIPAIAAAPTKTPNKPRKRPSEEMVGKPAPSFSITTTDGKPLSNDTKDTVTVLDFFAVNCGYCSKQIPRLEKVRAEFEGKKVRFVTVSQTMRKKFSDDEIKNKIKSLGFNGELAIDSGNTVGPLFKATGFPTMVILDKKGKIGAVNVGNVGDLEKRVKAQVNAMLEGKPVPTFASAAPSKSRERPAMKLVGKPAPQFDSIKTLAGKNLSSADYTKNKATVLNFVAPNCGFCKRAMPNVEKVRTQYESKGVRFVNVAQTMRKKYPVEEVKSILDKAGSNLELAYDGDNVVGKKFSAVSFPTMIVVDNKGKVANVNIGAKKDLETLLAGQLDAIIKASK